MEKSPISAVGCKHAHFIVNKSFVNHQRTFTCFHSGFPNSPYQSGIGKILCSLTGKNLKKKVRNFYEYVHYIFNEEDRDQLFIVGIAFERIQKGRTH